MNQGEKENRVATDRDPRDKAVFFNNEDLDSLRGALEKIKSDNGASARWALSLLLQKIVNGWTSPAVTQRWVDNHVAPAHEEFRRRINKIEDRLQFFNGAMETELRAAEERMDSRTKNYFVNCTGNLVKDVRALKDAVARLVAAEQATTPTQGCVAAGGLYHDINGDKMRCREASWLTDDVLVAVFVPADEEES